MVEEIEREQPGSPRPAEETARSGSPNEQLPNAPKARRRTKTGCLTCRKRRIKCGEERPICANCIKSKRSCEGYYHIHPFRNLPIAYPTPWPTGAYHDVPPNQPTQHVQTSISVQGNPPFLRIAPRPISEHRQFQQDLFQTPQNHLQYPISDFPPQNHQAMLPPGIQLQSYQPQVPLLLDPVNTDPVTSSYHLSDPQSLPIDPTLIFPAAPADIPSTLAPDLGYTYVSNENPQRLEAQPILVQVNQAFDNQAEEARMLENLISPTSYIPIISPSNGTYHLPNSDGLDVALHGDEQVPTQLYAIPNQGPDPQSLTYYSYHPAVAQLYEEDEYYDVESDEEMLDLDSPTAKSVQKKQRDLSHVLAISGQGLNLRSVGAFLNSPDTLATYVPKFTSSPLMDEDTARIFCHFVTATGPLMSGYGRHPVNPALLFSGTPVPKSQQALWTYTLPMMAISNQGLLHAILALASLNIARLQQAPLTVPMKHYQFALRRIAKAVATPGKRTSIATVAATILLSQFEVLSAEHSKWHSHLAGARQLFTEINFTQWTDKIYREKARRSTMNYVDSGMDSGWPRRPPWSDELPWVPDRGSPDEELLDRIRGSSVKQPIHGRYRKATSSDPNKPITEKEIDDFQTYRDLFWTYTKIDNIQSIVTGRRLLLPLDYWTHCPPRAPMNRFDAVYGSLDHLAILIGRVADFAGKDVARKKRAMKANGGAWKPSPGFFGPPTGMPPGVAPDMMPPGQGFPGGVPVSMMPPGEMPINVTPRNSFPQSHVSLNHPLPHELPPGVVLPSSMPPQDSLRSQPPAGMPGAGHQMHIPNGAGLMPTPLPQSINTSNATTSSTPTAAAPPTFSGLFPNDGKTAGMPAAFNQAPRDILYQMASQEIDVELSEATAAAEAEWNHIQEGFSVFEQSLGPAFAPLSAELGSTIETPFGPALQYRTFQIATCWLLFYMTKVIAIRTHPSMPSASMMAAGIAAPKTAGYCNMIGRINCGLQVPTPDQPLNPIFGGAIAETMLPMFVAGIQYRDNAQRNTTIERLQFIADRVGQNSAIFIAAGLERIWMEMHKAGRGPKYIPSVKVEDEYGRDLTEDQSVQRNGMDGGPSSFDGGFNRGPSTPLAKNRGTIVLQGNTRTFAAGVMGLEDGFGNLTIGTGPI